MKEKEDGVSDRRGGKARKSRGQREGVPGVTGKGIGSLILCRNPIILISKVKELC